MPLLFLYLAKLFICLAATYLFYRILLQRLTFYNLNRWFLLGYSFLSFFIPFINISPVVEQHNLSAFTLVQAIPVIDDLSNKNTGSVSAPASSWDVWHLLLVVYLAGATVMLARLVVQYISYTSISRSAQLLSLHPVCLYSVDKNIIPFSFGRAVFINPALHNPGELQEILRHEYVHVRQKHTMDIIWTELLCMLNWYNPFAWLIRQGIRENLEFIADHKVLEEGIEKKRYQYLLLKVMDCPLFPIAASFNFSSLKKRIHMMNKVKTAKVHLVKFLFVLPLLAVLLLAFRIAANKEGSNFPDQHATVSGIVMQSGSYKPLSNVRFTESFSQMQGTTDERGYYTFTIRVAAYPQKLHMLFTKEGYKNMESNATLSNNKNLNELNQAMFIGMVQQTAGDLSSSFVHALMLPEKTGQQDNYELVAKAFGNMKQYKEEVILVEKESADSDKPYQVVNGHTYLVSARGGTASVDTITDIVMVDGKKMTGKEVNEKFTRKMITNIGAMNKEIAQKKYGIDQDVMVIYLNTKPDWDSIPNTPRK